MDSCLGYGLRIPVLEFAINRYKSNQQKATYGLEYAISQRLPVMATLKQVVQQKKVHITESALHSKEYLSSKAKKASEIARSKAELATNKAKELPKVNASEV